MKIKNALWGFTIGCLLGANGALAGTTTRVNVSSEGEQASFFEVCDEVCFGDGIFPVGGCVGGSGAVSMSADGRSVAFESYAENLVSNEKSM